MHCGRSTYYGNPFLGAFGRSTDELTFLGNPPEKLHEACSRFLKTRLINMTVNGSNLTGLFMAANSKGAVFPEFISSDEMKLAKEAGLNTMVLEARLSAIGNNIVANDKIALVNPEMGKKDIPLIADCLGVEVIPRTIAGYPTIGSVCVLTNKGFLIHSSAGRELGELEKLLGIRGGIGTANMGVPFVGVCLITNSHGYVAGEQTGGFEMHRIDEALGFFGGK